jgi:hypothetical protein
MSLNKLAQFAVAVSYVTSAAAAGVKCPAVYHANKIHAPLEIASVFEGKPVKLVELMPDLDTTEWDISLSQMYVRQRGESMYLVCRYRGTKETVDLRIPGDATLCKVEGTLDGGTAAWCETSARRRPK